MPRPDVISDIALDIYYAAKSTYPNPYGESFTCEEEDYDYYGNCDDQAAEDRYDQYFDD